jgi:hypothetical protein
MPLADIPRRPRCRGHPQGDVLFADRGHLLSRLTTFPSENRDQAGHTGRPWAATLADIDRYRKAFGLWDPSATR